MAAETNNGVKKNFYTVRDHVFQKNVETKTEKALTREHNGKEYHYEIYKSLIGKFRKFLIWEEEQSDKKGTFKMLSIDLIDDQKNYECLQMYLSSQAADTMLRRFPNVDLNRDVKITIMKQTAEDNKELVFDLIVIYQKNPEGEWEKVPYYWDNKNLKKLPALEKVTVSGKQTTDRTKRMEFFERLANFKNAEQTDLYNALKNGLEYDQLQRREHDEFGTFIDYKPADTSAETE